MDFLSEFDATSGSGHVIAASTLGPSGIVSKCFRL
jgi:hypothetical protein